MFDAETGETTYMAIDDILNPPKKKKRRPTKFEKFLETSVTDPVKYEKWLKN